MGIIKTSELSGIALDWAVANSMGKEARQVQGLGKAVRLFKTIGYDPTPWQPSTDWAQGGPIIERERLQITTERDGAWVASIPYVVEIEGYRKYCFNSGPTPLIAALRCYVASKLGDTVEIPEELL
jgi:hypothetical protein